VNLKIMEEEISGTNWFLVRNANMIFKSTVSLNRPHLSTDVGPE